MAESWSADRIEKKPVKSLYLPVCIGQAPVTHCKSMTGNVAQKQL
jgi:hypothetical protein